MSTPAISFQLGETGSASKLMTAFNAIWSQGESILASLTNYRNLSLVDFNQKLEALNSRLQQANRIQAPYTAVSFVTTDFLNIDQTLTSATVRADSQAVTLKERSTSTNAVIQTQGFSTSDGTAQSISTDNSLYRVQVTDGSIPTGVFNLQLIAALDMTVLTFDLAAMPPTPVFAVSASPDGITFTPALRVSMNGYRLTAWFPPMEMLYITLAITPAAPDTLGGNSFTFGPTDFVGVQTRCLHPSGNQKPTRARQSDPRKTASIRLCCTLVSHTDTLTMLPHPGPSLRPHPGCESRDASQEKQPRGSKLEASLL